MISGLIFCEDLGKLIINSRKINSYKKILKFYKDDLPRYSPKIVQQDGALNHSSNIPKI